MRFFGKEASMADEDFEWNWNKTDIVDTWEDGNRLGNRIVLNKSLKQRLSDPNGCLEDLSADISRGLSMIMDEIEKLRKG